jgi:hypothetical protein
MTLGLWLCLFSFVIVLFPHSFVLKKFQRERANPFGKESFEAFQFFDIVWIVVCVGGLGWSLLAVDSHSHQFSLIAMFLALITMPIALYSGFTGIYPDRSRIGYYYFQQYKDPAKQFLMSSKYPELKILGWVQFIFLVGVASISVVHVFW